MFRLVYVFDARETHGYIRRVPRFVARIMVRRSPLPLDYAPTVEGY